MRFDVVPARKRRVYIPARSLARNAAARRVNRQEPQWQAAPVQSPTVDQAEVARFSALAEWWDPRGKTGRCTSSIRCGIGYIRDQVASAFGRDAKRLDCLAGLRILDIGCGGGMLSEPLARLGAAVVGADPAAANIEVAQTARRAERPRRSTTAAPPRRNWQMPASDSTWCWPWRSLSTSRTWRYSCAAAPTW